MLTMGVIHRDIKPENILFTADAVVADFGIAHVLQGRGRKATDRRHRHGHLHESRAVWRQGRWAQRRVQLGVRPVRDARGQVPFTGPNAMAIMARHTMEHVPSVRVVRSTVPENRVS
jgi:serine/threonine protein kinase